ncbi:flagellar motor switch protein FliM [Clostridia bacterium]|nr:flagellar motor switch protein FliM [Clostridia bacterium]
MADVLSQSEIDALLNAMNDGDPVPETPAVEEKVARDYDFRVAPRFSREHIRTFNVVYDSFARLFTSYLSGTLRVLCAAEVVSVEEVKYSEFVNSMPSSVILAIISMPPLAGPTLLEMAPDLAYIMIARLLGGSGASGMVEITRSFTEIELALLERVIRQFIGLLIESWEKIVTVQGVMLERIETSPQFAQIVALNDVVALVTIKVNIGNSEGFMNICLPQLALEPISKQLSTKLMFQATDSRNHPSKEAQIKDRLQKTLLPVRAVFNDTSTSVRDILGLQPGDILQLDHNLNQSLTLKVGHLSKFKGSIGIKDNRYALKISDIIREEETENE